MTWASWASGCPPWLREFLADCDAILAINIRFGETITDGYTLFDPATFDLPLAHIHASEAELGKIFSPDVAVLSDPNRAAERLAQMPGIARDGWAARTADIHGQWQSSLEAPAQSGALDMPAVVAHLRDVLPGDVIITKDRKLLFLAAHA